MLIVLTFQSGQGAEKAAREGSKRRAVREGQQEKAYSLFNLTKEQRPAYSLFESGQRAEQVDGHKAHSDD